MNLSGDSGGSENGDFCLRGNFKRNHVPAFLDFLPFLQIAPDLTGLREKAILATQTNLCLVGVRF